MCRNKSLVTLERSRIISAAQGHPGQHLAHLLKQLFTLRPACMLDDYPRGTTVEARVVSKHAIDVLGLVGQVTGAPVARHHDDRADISNLTCDALGQHRTMLLFAFCPLGSPAQDNRFKGLIRTRYMYFFIPRIFA